MAQDKLDEYDKAMRRLAMEAQNEQDKEYVEKIRRSLLSNRLVPTQWVDSDVWKLIALINRLEAEKAELLEAVETAQQTIDEVFKIMDNADIFDKGNWEDAEIWLNNLAETNQAALAKAKPQ